MKVTIFIIAALINGSLQIEAAYPMPSLVDCEKTATHSAIVDSYPERVFFCLDTSEHMDAIRKNVKIPKRR